MPVPHSTRSFAATDNTSVVSASTREGRLIVFDDLWETIEERYYDPTFRGIDWLAMRATFRPLAAQASNSPELYEVLRQMIKPLRDAHTRVYSPTEKFDWWKPRFVTTGVSIREIEALPTVVGVERNSAPARAGIQPGDVIVSIDSVAATELIERRLHSLLIPPFGTSARFRSIATLLEGPPETTVRLDWEKSNRKIKSQAFERYWSQRELGVHFERNGRFAVIEIQTFTQGVALNFAQALPKMLKSADGVVLDLRANGGGDAHAMADMASVFLGDGINLGRFADRSGVSFDLQTNSKMVWSAKSFVQTKLPLVVLTSENVIGTETCGCVLAIRNRHTLPDGGVLDVSELDYLTPEGFRLEGAGVKPDETIKLTRSDIYSRHDPAIEAAKTFLKSIKRK